MSFKLADLVNIALEDGTYFKTVEWCERNQGRVLVEHEQKDWEKQLFEAFEELLSVEKIDQNPIGPKQSDKFQPIVEFFRTLKDQKPSLKTKPVPVDVSLQTDLSNQLIKLGIKSEAIKESGVQTEKYEKP